MKNLTQSEESQLEALLAKKEAAEKLEEKVQEAVNHIGYEKDRLANAIAEAKSDAEDEIAVFKSLAAVDSKLFKLVSSKKQLERKLFEANHRGDKDFTPEQEKAAFAYLEIPSIYSLYGEVDVYHVDVVGLEQRPGVSIYVNNQAQTKGSGGYSYSFTGKTELRLSSADYNERWCTRPETLVKKIKEEKEARIYRAERARKARSEKDQVLEALTAKFPEAKVQADQVWKRDPWSKRGEGKYEQIIKVFVGTLELDFDYGTNHKTKEIWFAIKSCNFNLMSAVRASSEDIDGQVIMLQTLKNKLDTKKEE